MDRPALQHLLADIRAGKVDVVVRYKIDRLTRSLSDFAKITETFDAKGVSFVSVTQQFNTTTSMGRLTLNVLLSFAQFEREVTGERIRDKIVASKKKGMWMGGLPSASSASMPPSTTTSIFSATSFLDRHCGPFEPKRWRNGRLPSPPHEPELPPPALGPRSLT
jgi:Resolvase, N terminal domain